MLEKRVDYCYKKNFVAKCSPKSDLGHIQKSLGTSDLAIPAQGLEVFLHPLLLK